MTQRKEITSPKSPKSPFGKEAPLSVPGTTPPSDQCSQRAMRIGACDWMGRPVKPSALTMFCHASYIPRRGSKEMPLPRGSLRVSVNGMEGSLDLASDNADGMITGSVLGKPLRGVWNEATQDLRFRSSPALLQARAIVERSLGTLFGPFSRRQVRMFC